MINTQPTVKIVKYARSYTAEIVFNKIAADIMNFPKELAIYLTNQGIKLKIPGIDDRKSYKMDPHNHTLSLSLDENYLGEYDFYRVNEDEFFLTKKV